MTYAGSRDVLDADSHLMELAGFLDPYLDPDLRGRLRRQQVDALGPVLEDATSRAAARRADPVRRAEAEGRLLQDKGWRALGAFDPEERSRVLDLFGFRGQLVFATFASALFGRTAVQRRLHQWPRLHLTGMGASYILMLTAFYVDNGKNLPLWDRLPVAAYWLLPAIVAAPVIWRAIRRH